MQRAPHDDESQFALWSRKRFLLAGDGGSVVVAHADRPVGESIALLLRLKGFAAVHACDMDSVALMMEHWKPRALLIDTRLGRQDNFQFVRATAEDPAFCSMLLVAMTEALREESPETIRGIGFDGLCRRPCPVWQLAEMLSDHFRQS